MRGFDLILLSGNKVRDRMLAEGLITPANHRIVGYPKFDTLSTSQPLARLFDNGRPTVLYNPHFDPRLSSWYTMGPAILDWFAGQSRFNLVFAPHVMLFKRLIHASVEHRRLRWRGSCARAVWRASAHADRSRQRPLGRHDLHARRRHLSRRRQQPDLRMDRAAQARNFPRSRGCGLARRSQFRALASGQDCRPGRGLAIRTGPALANPDAFKEAQIEAFRATFSRTDEPASHRAANAIVEWFGP